MRRNVPVIVAIVIVAVLVLGEALVTSSPYHCDASLDVDGTSATYSFDTNEHVGYSVVSASGSSTCGISRYVVYDAHGYTAPYGPETRDLSVSTLTHQLSKFNLKVDRIDSDGLRDLMTSIDVSVAVINVSGTLPDSVYSGSSSDPVFTWLAAGGVMYWSGDVVGRCSSSPDGNMVEVANSDELFFGVSDVITSGSERSYSRVRVNPVVSDGFGLFFSEVTYSVDPTKLISDHLDAGYGDGNSVSTSFVRYHGGSGMICVLGGYTDGVSAPMVAQVVASHLGYDSVIVDSAHGDSAAGASGTVSVSSTKGFVFVYLSKMSPVWGKAFVIGGSP